MPVPTKRDPEETRIPLTEWLAERMPDASDFEVDSIVTRLLAKLLDNGER